MSTILISIVASFFAFMGIAALVQPERILRTFGIASLTTAARNEVRAVYGGFGIAIAWLLLASLEHASVKTGVLLAVAIALLGMAAGRVISALLDRAIGRYPLLFLLVELALAAMLMMAMRSGASGIPG
jgi:hypothetical protein